MDYNVLIKRALEKDKDAWSELYKATSNSTYFTAYSMMKNKEDALDVMQNSYIAAFSKLEQLEDAVSFAAWIKRIVVNNCKNMLKQKRPDLFHTEDAENFILNNIEEQSEDFLPEDYIIREAKRKQLMDIIKGCQRCRRLQFYFFIMMNYQ